MHAESNGVAAHFSDAEWVALREELGSLAAREIDARPTLSALYRHSEYNPRQVVIKEAQHKSWTIGYRDGRDEAVEPEDTEEAEEESEPSFEIPDGYTLVSDDYYNKMHTDEDLAESYHKGWIAGSQSALTSLFVAIPEEIAAAKGKKYANVASVLDWFESIANVMADGRYMMDGDLDTLVTVLEEARESYQSADLHQRHVTGNDIP